MALVKTVSKIIKIASSIGLAAVLLALPSAPTFAVSGTTNAAACTRITTLSDTESAIVAGHIASMNDDFATRLTNIANRSTTIDPKVDAARAKAITEFDTKTTKIETQSGLTTDQKVAIATYTSSMHTAEVARETAIDATRVTYRTDLMTLVKTHQANLVTATTTYQTAVSAAFTAAGINCGDGTATATLRTSVKSAKDTFKTARSDTKISTNIKTLMTTRDAAIATADATFTKDTATYTAILSTVLDAAPATTTTTNTP